MISYQADGVELPKIKHREITAWIKAVAKTYGRRVGDIGYMFVDDEKILEVKQETAEKLSEVSGNETVSGSDYNKLIGEWNNEN